MRMVYLVTDIISKREGERYNGCQLFTIFTELQLSNKLVRRNSNRSW